MGNFIVPQQDATALVLQMQSVCLHVLELVEKEKLHPWWGSEGDISLLCSFKKKDTDLDYNTDPWEHTTDIRMSVSLHSWEVSQGHFHSY